MSALLAGLDASTDVGREVLDFEGDDDGDGEARSYKRLTRWRPPGVPRSASWGERGGHWEAIGYAKYQWFIFA
jgi:hypothetical protein